jgi:integrase
VFQRERDSKWVAVLELPRGPDGKRQRKTYVGRTEREVRDKLKAAQRALEAGRDLTAGDRLLRDYLQHWLESEILPSDRSQSTKVGHELNVRLHLSPVIGHIRLANLDAVAVRQVHSAMSAKGLSTRTQQSAHVTLRAALQHALVTGLLGRNVASLVRAPRPQRDPNKVHALEPAVAGAIVRHTEGQPLHALWVLLLTTGVRKGEALALRWADLDTERSVLRVERSMFRLSGGGLVFKDTKTTNSMRSVPLPRLTLDALIEHRRRQIEARLLAGPYWSDYDLLFCGATGRPLDLKVPNVELRRVCKELDIPTERVHNLRHTAATIGGVVAGGDMALVSRQLGHASITTTIDMYRHAVTESQRFLIDGIADAILRGSSLDERQADA